MGLSYRVMEETGEERIERRVDGRFKGEKKRFEEI